MFIVSTPKQKKALNTAIPSASSSSNTSTDRLPGSSSQNNNTYTYNGNHFQMTYRTDIYDASGNKDNGEDNIILKPKPSSSLGDHFISIEVQPSSKLSVATLTAIFNTFKYDKSDLNLNGVPATRFAGSLKTTASSTSDDAIIFPRNNFTYKIQLSYKGNNDSKIEESFNNFLKGFVAY